MKFWITFMQIVAVSLVAEGHNFSPDVPRCKVGDNDCIVNSINYIFKNKGSGESTYNIPNLSPLSIDRMNIKQGKESPVNIDMLFTKNDLFYIPDGQITKTSGFGKDLKGPHEFIMKAKRISLIGDYKIDGRVLILPIQGVGKSNITITGVQYKIRFEGKPIEKDGKIYMEAVKLKTQLQVKRMWTHLTNLFNGDRLLGDNMNLFLNDNWKDIFGELKAAIENAFAPVFQNVINSVFLSHPYDELFES